MANQSPDRRTVLEMLAKVAAVSQFPGFSRWSFAAAQDHEHHHLLNQRSVSTPILLRPPNTIC